MMQEDDPRVKELQNLAWSLQTLSNKPGGRLPEPHKRAAYRVVSRALSICTDAVYTEEADFVQRAAAATKEIEAKKVELQEAEEAENKKLAGKCYRASSGGGYVVGEKTGPPAAREDTPADAHGTLATSAGSGARAALPASDVASRCADDPQVLHLSGCGITDDDLDALCEGLRSAGSSLTLLDLSSNVLADAGIQRFVGALAAGMCPKLQELRLGGNAFGPLGLQMLTGGLCALRRSLVVRTSLDTDGEPDTSDGGASAGTGRPAPSGSSSRAPGAEVRPSGSGDEVPPEAAPAAAAGAESGPSAAGTAAACVEIVEVPRGEDAGAPCGGGSQVRATVSVPEGCASSARDLELDVSERRLVVRALAGRLLADAGLPRAVDPDSAQAAFSRKKRTVTITLQVAC